MKLSIRDMILVGLFAALMVVGAKLSIPTPFGVPLTFQLFFAIYAGLLLGGKLGFLSQAIYIVIGIIGVPVFTYGGGPQYIFNPTFGYLIGFAVTALVTGLIMDRVKNLKILNVLLASLAGYALTYVIGNIYFYMIKNVYVGDAISLGTVFKVMTLYMIKDLVLMVIAALTTTMILPVLRKAGYLQRASV